MNATVISIIMIAVSAVIIGLCTLLGFSRGLRAGLIRLVTVIVAFVIAIFLKGIAFDALNSAIDFKNILGSSLSSSAEKVLLVFEMLTYLLTFVIVFIVLSLIMMIVYACLKKLGKDKNEILENKWLGLAIGVVLGVLIVVGTVLPINGVLVAGADLVEAVGIVADTQEDIANPLESLSFLKDYADSGVGKAFASIDDIIVNPITNTEDENGKKITLDGQIDGIYASAKLADVFNKVSKIRFDGNDEMTPQSTRELFNNLSKIQKELSEESMEMFQVVVENTGKELLKDTNIEIDFDNIDLSKVDFEKEGEIIAELLEEEPTFESAAKLMVKSDVVIDVLESSNATFDLTDEQKTSVLNTLEGVDEETVAKICKIYKIEK